MDMKAEWKAAWREARRNKGASDERGTLPRVACGTAAWRRTKRLEGFVRYNGVAGATRRVARQHYATELRTAPTVAQRDAVLAQYREWCHRVLAEGIGDTPVYCCTSNRWEW